MPGATSPLQLNLVQWHLIFVGPQYYYCYYYYNNNNYYYYYYYYYYYDY
jgi:hypothetical protein